MNFRVYIGFDSREQDAFAVSVFTAERFGCQVEPLYEDRLRMSGLLTRPVDRRKGMWDLNSSAAQSTEFAITRFFVPLLAHSGWCLFADCDVVFLEDPRVLRKRLPNDSKAVYVVKHPPETVTQQTTKMDGQLQQLYYRKLWSSVMLFNVDHPANRRLNLITLNQWPGRDLHAFKWLADEEIGELPPEANWLVGLQPKPVKPIVAHFTLGTPNMDGVQCQDYADIWFDAAKSMVEGLDHAT